ncbi:serine protease inhibitor 88Ea isoform X2 [Nilaparvata lugens]|uniref:serine protease inhibitor 88Ea isoform X1 n=1 Tax=Nilaparvata lugens TaxID=108931 RepID=UPI00193E946A|nr:serine protease inhibitor 88Ea isoform X1 [Nilaparvata lugens]XP_039295628.1 serine protease inhibitor 88Ea isoform X2 [Nilaparvata lugens]
MMILWMCVVAVTLPVFTNQQCLTKDDSKPSTDPQARLALFRGQQEFSLAMLQTVNHMYPNQNIFFSPHSIYQAMLLSYFVAANHTEASIKKAIFLPKQQDKLSTMQAYRLEKFFQSMRLVNGSDSYELRSANRLFVSQQQKVKECMLELFKDEVQQVDFAKSAESAQVINQWVANQTKNNIKELIPEGSISETTQLILTNAAYFKGLWKSKFLKSNSRKEIFYINSSKNAFVTMMRQKGTFNHAVSEQLGAHILELPYKGDDVSMFVLLPPFASPSGITNILKRLTLKTLHEIIDEDSMIPRAVEVSIPKFEVEKSIELVQILTSFGIDMFEDTADLSSLTDATGPRVRFTDAVHKARLQVDEDGTTAAAATAVLSFRSSRPLDPAQFICNHPFVYIIYDKVAQVVLFTGVYSTPEGGNEAQ